MPFQISKTSPLILLILDGWGYNKTALGNAILQSKTPFLDEIRKNYPYVLLQASGLAVGMDWGESGNSEIGHLTLGSGRSIQQYSLRINESIKEGSFFTNPALLGAFAHANVNQSAVHIAGLLTSGSVHAYFGHIEALVDLAIKAGNPELQVHFHLFLDGKDSGLREGLELLQKLDPVMAKFPNARISTVMGRDFSMDRNNNWGLTEKAYRLMVGAEGAKTDDVKTSVQAYYDSGINDPDVPPIALNSFPGMADNDALIFFNFREDSMRQITRSFVEPAEEWPFPRSQFTSLYVATMTEYIESPNIHIAFLPPNITNSLPEVVSNYGMNQLHIAESEKYAHVTYFFNGLATREFPGEVNVFIKSEKKPKEDPNMQVAAITEKIMQEIDNGTYEFIVANFANGDMLAHEGDLGAAKIGVQKIDEMVGKLKEKILSVNGIMLITSDHGNVESMTYKGTGALETKHDPNPVPFHLIGNDFMKEKTDEEIKRAESVIDGIIADVAPTALELMNIEKPIEMTGQSLLNQLVEMPEGT